ncbi:MAG: PAS domain S-box protein [Bacteroidetes bacterium]|nr:PAS domain S-box protein [Bacteroidota bacterium]
MIEPGEIKVLIVEDNAGDAILVEEYLKVSDIGIRSVHIAGDLEAAAKIISEVDISVALLDLNLVHTRGLETFERFVKIAPKIPVVVLSGSDDEEIALETMKRGAQDYLVKGNYHPSLLGKSLHYAIERSCYLISLKLKDDEYKYLFDNNPNPLIAWEKNSFRVLRANKSALNFYGNINKEFLNTSILDLFNSNEINNSFLNDLQSKELIEECHQVLRGSVNVFADLHFKDIEIDNTPARIMLVNDVTEKRMALYRMQESEQLIRKLAKNYPNGIIAILDRNLVFQFIDGMELQLKNLKPDFMLGKKYTDFLDESNQAKFIQNMAPVFEGKRVVFDKEMGSESFLISAAGLANSEGVYDRAILVSQNITGSVLSKKEILFQATILRNVNDAIVVTDLNGKVIYWNEGASRLFGYASLEVMGLEASKFIDDHLVTDFATGEADLSDSQIHKKYVFTIKGSEGQFCHVESKQAFMNDENGKPQFVICVYRDITDQVETHKVLMESEANLQAIFHSTSQSFILMDTNTRIITFNKNAAEFVFELYQKQLTKGNYFTDLLLPERRKPFEDSIRKVLGNQIVKFELQYNFPSRNQVYIETTYSPVLKDNKVIGIIICAEDTTEKFRTKEEIFKSESKYRELVESSKDMIWTIDRNSTVVFANKACQEILGWDSSVLIGRNFMSFVAEGDREKVMHDIQHAFDSDKQFQDYQSRVLNKNGKVVTVITNMVGQIDSTGRKVLMTGTSRDISARVQAEKELNEKNEQLQLLSSYLQTIREEERSHISREIHDELGQLLTGLKMDLVWLNKRILEKDPDSTVKIKEMIEIVDETVKSVRKIATELRPGILDDLGLIPAIEWQCAEFEKKSGIPCEFINSVGDINIDKPVSTGVFRILQETFTNIARHASAALVQVELFKQKGMCNLTIKDNGIGFDNANDTKSKTLGLMGMKERAIMLGGSLEIHSKRHAGTTISLRFPTSI